MRTTLDIDDDVLQAAKELARAEGKTAGQVLSELARRALTAPSRPSGFAEDRPQALDDDWPTFPRGDGPPVTPEMIERIQEEIDLEDATAWDHSTDTPRR